MITGLNIPWGMVFINDSLVLIAEKSGDVILGNVYTGSKEVLFKVPNAVVYGQGGLMDIRLHPFFNQNKLVYFTYTKQVSGLYTTAVGRAIYENKSFKNFQEIFVAEMLSNSGVHFGSRLIFDGKGHFYLGLGDRGNMQQSQNTKNHMGCILRLQEDGSVPSDNPFVTNPDFLPEIWTNGHRNIQGMAINPITGELWAHEHGPQGGDEINVIKKGLNYGWPLATYGQQYGGGKIADPSYPGTEQPIHYWTPSIAPCGMAFITSNRYPGWSGHLLIGALAGQHLNKTSFQGSTLSSEWRYFQGEGRIRNVVESTDGWIYFSDESNGILYKLVPKI
ncbi:PQQ-dependent sugar dehydrogenase [Thermaurantimonas aggregans]|uniref:PQQ-dependent sugar dehydrogenase n=1 Tax=Thermaurantimonas aggregans TaxID=2173829 RepID=UPI00135AB9D6|nr:PQQ-dependent sugar dehydrogenase [Thermaurantimonas aggregans]MCX8148895.1 PQQ-dependent sugar dehydrogenase [Thermaurantimonas aggregans]